MSLEEFWRYKQKLKEDIELEKKITNHCQELEQERYRKIYEINNIYNQLINGEQEKLRTLWHCSHPIVLEFKISNDYNNYENSIFYCLACNLIKGFRFCQSVPIAIHLKVGEYEDIQKIINELLQELVLQSPDMSMKELKEYLYDYFKRKRYILKRGLGEANES